MRLQSSRMVRGSSRALAPIDKVKCNTEIINIHVYTQLKASILSFMNISLMKGMYF
jgi:hypothetical protein